MTATTPAPRLLGAETWPSIDGRPVLVVPLGSTEQHGPHLPLATDLVIAVAVAEGLAARMGDGTLVAPALPFGASGEHAGFPGTVSIGLEVLERAVVEIGRSATAWARAVVFVNGHGGNAAAVDRAVRLLVEEGRDVRWVPCAVAGADAHAGRTETSLLLHLRPVDVRPGEAVAGNTAPLTDLLPALRARGVLAVSPNGVLGDPAGADPAEGRLLLARMVDTAERLLAARSA